MKEEFENNVVILQNHYPNDYLIKIKHNEIIADKRHKCKYL